MLLQRLAQFAAQRETDENPIPAFYIEKPVRWVLRLHADGTPETLDMTDRADPSDTARRFGTPMAVPSVTKTSAPAPTPGVDTVEYVFGWVTTDPKANVKPDKVVKRHKAFIALNERWARDDPDSPASAIAAFYRDGHHRTIMEPMRINGRGEELQRVPAWSRGDLVCFEIDGAKAAASTSAQRFWASIAAERKGSGTSGLCLVCGEWAELLKTVPQQLPQRLVPGATQSASLVSVNKPTHGFDLTTELRHTPICQGCGLRVMSGLGMLLDDKQHSTGSGDSRMAWWTIGGEQVSLDMLLHPHQHLDDVHHLITAARTGHRHSVKDIDTGRFCSVIVGGNVSRIMVRDWVEQPLTQVQANLGRWFNDITTTDGDNTRLPGVGLLALACGRYDPKLTAESGGYLGFNKPGADRPDGVYRSLLQAALYGRRLPPGLSKHIIHRIRRDGYLDPARAALLHVGRIRQATTNDQKEPMEITTSSTEEPAKVAGQIFAMYEYLQWAATNPTPNKTTGRAERVNTSFTDRHFSGAITNPRRALTAGARISQAWLKRVRRDNPARAEWIDRQLTELYEHLNQAGGPPSTALLSQQSDFILGYYQQRQQRFANRSANNTTTETESNDE
ncbi:type I-C CRISPR-associated protein Cas8c/Csd1 [Stackebrandtia nassauensis]|uniref:CRISPR-associated protein, Csd1 family n=1 Tax=Stackebrandtia nassauensis (strain DSM 44728 / CIP 108903 / NRRL B-16338 / NBRC 102104 / LLR-40K-21) TaxID=446470 RepID=D3PWL9_STANL|nr:type I-C CRISPR-associated protein Cas8c/Csd1 [Stackebrandtia nassauensis]ADD43241.1 hypothetical protein Snas_3580 [Stackebrandtia nassauensis DSM 44728]